MAQVRDIIKINVAPEIVWQVLARYVAAESAGNYEDDTHLSQDTCCPADAGKGYEPTPLGILSHPEEEPQTWGELTMPILQSYGLLHRACATFSVESHDQGTVVRLSIDYKLALPGVTLVGWGKRFSLSPGLLGKLMLYPRVGRMLLKVIRKTLLDLKLQIEAGEKVARKVSAMQEQTL